MARRYFKPYSLSWWASLLPFGAGMFMATEPFHRLHEYVEFVYNVTGGMSAAVLINMGLIGIGLRGAFDDGK